MSLADFIAETAPIEPKARPEVEEVVTPSGLTIRYDDRKHWYWIDGERVDSVSKILGVLDKPALPWWGMRVGVEGVKTLFAQGRLPFLAFAEIDTVVALLIEHKLTVNHVRDKAGVRGTTVHDALETWARTGALPDEERYATEQQGYVRGLLTFLKDATIEPNATETIVGSSTHRFAGRYDLRARLDGASCLLDLKTTKSVYLEALLQMEAYEGASIECGYEPTEGRVVLRVTADGTYEFVRSTATYADFLTVKACHDAVAALKQRGAA